VLSFADSAILLHLDWLEDYHPHRPAAQNEYNRQLIEIYNSAFASGNGLGLFDDWNRFSSVMVFSLPTAGGVVVG